MPRKERPRSRGSHDIVRLPPSHAKRASARLAGAFGGGGQPEDPAVTRSARLQPGQVFVASALSRSTRPASNSVDCADARRKVRSPNRRRASPERSETEQLLDARRTLSGIEWFRKVLSGDVPRVPMLKLLGMRLLEADRGRVVFGATPRAAHYNGVGVAHGGFAATLLDSALGCAINTMTPPGVHFTTLELKINFTRAIVSEVGPLRCEATVVHMGSRTATAEGRVVDRAGRLYAHGTTTCIVWEPSPRGPRRR